MPTVDAIQFFKADAKDATTIRLSLLILPPDQSSPIPLPILLVRVVDYKDTFLLIGGRRDYHIDTIYEFDLSTNGWIERSERLETYRSGHVVGRQFSVQVNAPCVLAVRVCTLYKQTIGPRAFWTSYNAV